MSNLSPKIWRDKRHAPARLQQLIKLANSFKAGYRASSEKEPTQKSNPTRGGHLAALWDLPPWLDPDIRKAPLFGSRKVHAALMLAFEVPRVAATWLRKIARMGSLCRRYKTRPGEIPPIGLSTVRAQVDQQGKLHLSVGPMIAALEGVDPSRIRICKVCKRIYWAVRSDARCCSKECSHKLRTRRWRLNYLEVHKAQRVKQAAEEQASRITRERERLAPLKAPTRGTGRREPRMPKGPKHK
jgi:hypothetical protein